MRATFTDADHTKYTADSAENVKAIQALVDSKAIGFDASIAGGDEINLFRQGVLNVAFCWNIAQQLNADNNDAGLTNDGDEILFMAFPSEKATDTKLCGGIWGFGVFDNKDANKIDANYLPDGWRSYMAKAVKEKYGKPCMTVGNIRDPKVAEDILAKGDADFIGMGRGLIADPEWVNKVEFGNECDIRKCISCNIGCAGHRIGLNQPIRCTVNPAVNTGEDYMKQKVNKPCNVVVIGGGTAGLEAACTAAEVGCTTFLIEKKAELGGLASVISKIPDKKRLADFPNYMIHRAGRLHNLFIFKNTSATAELVKSLNPDIIVNATGSVPTLPPITGLHDLVDKDGTNVATVLKMIERLNEYPEDMTGKKVSIIGGGAVGLDVMEFFTERGAEVSMVEMLPMIGNGLDPVTKCDTNAKMAKYHVKQMTNTALQEVKNDRFIVKNPEGEIEEVPFDYGFICLGMRANTPVLSEIEEAFSDTNVEIVNIGDSKRARRIIEGTEEGRNILNVLARHDYL